VYRNLLGVRAWPGIGPASRRSCRSASGGATCAATRCLWVRPRPQPVCWCRTAADGGSHRRALVVVDADAPFVDRNVRMAISASPAMESQASVSGQPSDGSFLP